VKGPADVPDMAIQKAVFENHRDSYYKECGMKW